VVIPPPPPPLPPPAPKSYGPEIIESLVPWPVLGSTSAVKYQ